MKMPPIRVLPTHLVNRIAAGEVIERPASVVKELLENAIDAGATRIDVRIADGGRKLISVSDDGSGMSVEDASRAFTPHATSKISEDDDLFRIGTLGFRGEALASIASVSHAHIRTRRRDSGDDAGGCEVEASADTVGSPRPCPASVGTTITVRDLFFNVPARRKFLRSAPTEMGHITEQVTRLALAHPQIALTLSNNGREVLNLSPAQSTITRIGETFGPDLAATLMGISSGKSDSLQIDGLLAPPSAGRASGKWQYFFLNGRYIRDRLLTHAVREAFRGLIPPNRWPVVFIFIEIDPAEVDVNVHPTKVEVRFRNGQLVHSELLSVLRETLNRADIAPAASLTPPGEVPAGDAGRGQRESLQDALAVFFTSKSTPTIQGQLEFSDSRSPVPSAGGAPAPQSLPAIRQHHAPSIAALEPSSPPAAETTTETAELPAVAAPLRQQNAIQVHGAYIVAECDDGMIILDQHALHERIIYDELAHRLTEASLTSQRLLIPETFTVTAGEAEILARQAGLLRRLGMEVTPFGPHTWAVQQFPSLLAGRGTPAGEFMRQIIDRLTEDDETAGAERLLQDVLSMIACKAAVKAGQTLTGDEIDSLLSRRDTAEKPSACPHGRPTTLKLTIEDLAKQFKRT